MDNTNGAPAQNRGQQRNPRPNPTPNTPAASGEAPGATPPAAAADTSPTTTAKTADAVEATKGEYTVAPGRTVDGKAPGEKVTLDAGDAKRMLKLGFILDEDGSVVVRADGPAVNVEDGVQVKTGA